jgi:hypothetical protein
MKHSTSLAVLLSALLPGCAITPSVPTASLGDIAGTWGEDMADCQSNPHRISFSSQGDVMHVRYPEGGTADGRSLQEQFSYKVLGRSPSGLQLALVGESRNDNSGNPVTWELRQNEKDSYCWWRSDWPANECTVPRTRCEL